VLGLVGFTMLWLLPMLHAGLTGGYQIPFYPRPLSHVTKLANVSCLFIHSVRDWWWFYVQAKPVSGSAWMTLPEEHYFRMKAFGFHTRLDEFMRRDMGQQSILELTDWVRGRYVELNPGADPPAAVRIVGGVFRVGEPIPRGRWRKPPLESLDEHHSGMWYERTFEPNPATP
jgi:hypothetical protein